MSNLSEHPPSLLSFTDLRAVLKVTLHAGQLLLEHGADAHRVEETIQRMGHALGVVSMDVYVTPTGIIASASNGQEQRTIIQRVRMGAVDLSRIDAINHLSRRIEAEQLDLVTVAARLDTIARRRRGYGQPLTLATLALACACFALLFGGGWRDMLIAAVGATVVVLVRQKLTTFDVGLLLQITPAALAGALVALVLGRLIGSAQVDVFVPSSILPLVPGVPLINALSDLLASDFVSGVTRAAQALLISAEIAVGVALALDVMRWLGWGG